LRKYEGRRANNVEGKEKEGWAAKFRGRGYKPLYYNIRDKKSRRIHVVMRERNTKEQLSMLSGI
jgi:hypothetical protein